MFKRKNKTATNDRFETVSRGRVPGTTIQDVVLRDRQTGVCYLLTSWGYGTGLSPLLDAEGKPVVLDDKPATTR
ncbi:DUF6440 family protein [Actinomyces howellii]|uniref:DUF6440 domain-containing protein n=1 Tax=Actinomyces howellii TaxID=52771 RepID=A0A3S4R062_9ACTO|nr:DUF6440 family protein [Actinomyces howellii]VEG27098.1 Uncharacterised protein [Actinomyces howellii]